MAKIIEKNNLFTYRKIVNPLSIWSLARLIILTVSERLLNNALLKLGHRIPYGVDGNGSQWNIVVLPKLQFQKSF